MHRPAPGDRICAIGDIPDGGAHEAVLGEGRQALSVLLLRQGSTVTAFRNACPHFQTPLNPRPGAFLISAPGEIMCGFHSAVFRFSDGLCIDGPCKGGGLDPIAVRTDGGDVLAA